MSDQYIPKNQPNTPEREDYRRGITDEMPPTGSFGEGSGYGTGLGIAIVVLVAAVIGFTMFGSGSNTAPPAGDNPAYGSQNSAAPITPMVPDTTAPAAPDTGTATPAPDAGTGAPAQPDTNTTAPANP